MTILNSGDTEPPVGTVVRDAIGRTWMRDDHWPACWTQDSYPDTDPETWGHVAGNFGPVTVLELAEA